MQLRIVTGRATVAHIAIMRRPTSANVLLWSSALLLALLLACGSVAPAAADEANGRQPDAASAADVSAAALQSSSASRDDIFIDDQNIEGSAGGHGEIHDDLEKENDYSGSGFGPDDEDSSSPDHPIGNSNNYNTHAAKKPIDGGSGAAGGHTNRKDPDHDDDEAAVDLEPGSGSHPFESTGDFDDDEDGQDRLPARRPEIWPTTGENDDDVDEDDDDIHFTDEEEHSSTSQPPKPVTPNIHPDDEDNEDDHDDDNDDDDHNLDGRHNPNLTPIGGGDESNIDVDLDENRTTNSYDKTGSDVSIMNAKNEDRTTSFFAQPGILAAVIGGAVVGLLCAILVVMFIVYRMRKKDEGSYALDEPKRSPAVNSYAKNPNNREFYA